MSKREKYLKRANKKQARAEKKTYRSQIRREWLQRHRRSLAKARRRSFHILSVTLLVSIALLGFLRVPGVCLRFWESLRDFCHSFVTPTVTQLPHDMTEGFPHAFGDLKNIIIGFGTAFFSRENFFGYLGMLGNGMKSMLYVLAYAALPTVAVIIILIIRSSSVSNQEYAKTSIPLKVWLRIRECLILPVKRYVKEFLSFFWRQRKYKVPFVLIVLFFLNVYTIAIEFFAFYFYLVFSLDGIKVQSLAIPIIKLLYDVWLAFRFLPAALWALLGLWIFDRWRKHIGYSRLEKQEEAMREFLDDRGVNLLICGPPRTGKTTLLISLAKSRVAMARKDAHGGMRDIERKFPDFPWIILEKMIAQEYEKGKIRTLSQVDSWIKGMISAADSSDDLNRKKWCKVLQKRYGTCSAKPFAFPFFNYDRKHFATSYDGKLGVEKLEERVRDYAMLYLIYIQPMLAIANLSVRMDNDIIDCGNFPEWRDDFFRHDPDPVEASLYAHIFNQDLVRPGKQLDPTCEYVNCFEYGTLVMTEVGKERGNQYDRGGKRREDPEANTVNDLFDTELKLMGHKGTVYFKRFAFFLGDEQRPESWAANARELCDVATIRERCRDKIMMPFFALEEAAYLLTKKIFGKYHDTQRLLRGDRTLIMYGLEHFCKMIYDHYERVKNKFGGHFLKINVEMGMKSAEERGDKRADIQKEKLFISNVKVYANVFRTDAWRGVMEARAARSKLGLSDIPCYKSVDATFDEFLEQKSYFFRDLLKVYCGEEQETLLDVLLAELRSLSQRAQREFGKEDALTLLGKVADEIPKLLGDKDLTVRKLHELLQCEAAKSLQACRKEKADAEKKETAGTKKALESGGSEAKKTQKGTAA